MKGLQKCVVFALVVVLVALSVVVAVGLPDVVAWLSASASNCNARGENAAGIFYLRRCQ